MKLKAKCRDERIEPFLEAGGNTCVNECLPSPTAFSVPSLFALVPGNERPAGALAHRRHVFTNSSFTSGNYHFVLPGNNRLYGPRQQFFRSFHSYKGMSLVLLLNILTCRKQSLCNEIIFSLYLHRIVPWKVQGNSTMCF